jgi:hypothetical protein
MRRSTELSLSPQLVLPEQGDFGAVKVCRTSVCQMSVYQNAEAHTVGELTCYVVF